MSSTQQENIVFKDELEAADWRALFKHRSAQAEWPQDGSLPVFNEHGAAGATTWRLAEEAYRSDRVLELRVIGFNKGGLLVFWHDLQGFVPASQLLNFPLLHVEHERARALAGLQGRLLRLKIIELNPEKNRLILSERAAEVDTEQRVGLLFQLRPGDVLTGRVTNLSDFGAFVDLGGLEGLIHISELSWSRVVHPSQIVQPGQRLEVVVLHVDRERERVALSYKQMRTDPWMTAESRYQSGQIVKGLISNVTSFGIFVLLEEELEGLVHVSEVPQEPFMQPGKTLRAGEPLLARVLHVDGAKKRLALSLRLSAESS
ncbi:MAG: S1 RNA-binding domain-containing protein [Candidatus Promineifilaceae bacterium]